MLRWIAHLSDLRSMDATLDSTARLANQSLEMFRRAPALGGTPMNDHTVWPEKLNSLPSPKSGFIQAIDVAALDKGCSGPGNIIYVMHRPGKLILWRASHWRRSRGKPRRKCWRKWPLPS